ncbi:MAG TPA: ABC transporter permease [Puia sp.]|nr:ABC transporter permease [Puia sp.]
MNYIKSAVKRLLRDKTNAFINILGLTVGMTCCLLIGIYIKDELSFNQFNINRDDIYRVNWISRDNNGVSTGASTPVPFSQNLAEKVPDIDKIARLYQRSGEMESAGTAGRERRRFQEQGIYFADKDVFSIFTIQFRSGNQNTALTSPNTVVITDEIAGKYFGTESPLGKTLIYENKCPLEITGVVRKMPLNSDIKFDFLISFETVFSVESPAFADFVRNDWTFTPCETWVRLRPTANAEKIERAFNKHLFENGTDRNHKMNTVRLQPLELIHLHASDIVGNESASDISYIYIFAGVALLILVIANINFINLSIAQSISRINEVGVRKVLGAEKKQIVTSFLSSTLFTGIIAFLLSIALTGLVMPMLNLLTGKQMDWHSWMNPGILFLFAVIFFISCVLAGLYPAFYITRFNTILALKGRSGDPRKKNRIQKVLLVTQFCCFHFINYCNRCCLPAIAIPAKQTFGLSETTNARSSDIRIRGIQLWTESGFLCKKADE